MVIDRCRPVLGIVTPLGWGVAMAMLALWIAGARLHWVEFGLIAAFLLVLLVASIALTIGRSTLQVTVEVSPRRVVAGSPAAGRVSVTNVSRAPLVPLVLELPIGETGARFMLPGLRPQAEHEELFVVPTSRRGVIPLGPATTVRGDPFGLMKRAVPWTERQELFVHPVTVPLQALGSGLLRDLEGQPTSDLSMSDLAFNALREFVPGDDRRFIHWRSSAKSHGANPSAPFLVRQFLDTRRSHVLVVVDSDESSYADPEEYEIAVQIGASIAIRAIQDQMETTVFAGGQVADNKPLHMTLDAFSRATFVRSAFLEQVGTAVRQVPEASLAFLVTGTNPEFSDLRRSAARFASETRKVVFRVAPQAELNYGLTSALNILTLPTLADLPRALRSVVLQ
jgi:uncharacterized protein (DUF58 family)